MYLEVDAVTFKTTNQQGFNTHKITDVEVFADGFSIGVFNLPARVPVLQQSDSVAISIFPVIRNNGIASNPVSYPFYDRVDYNFKFEASSVVTVNPEFKYRDDAILVQICDFESNNCLSNNYDNNPATKFVQSSETDFGNFCGKISLPEQNVFFEKSSFNSVQKSQFTGNLVFLELDYRCTVPFTVGVLLRGGGVPDYPVYKVALTEQEEWNKVYIELSQEVSNELVESFQILFGTTTATTDIGDIWLDNIRVIHF